MSSRLKATPYRIICRWVPSPQSNSKVSPSRTTATEATLRSTVGREAEVPRRRMESDMGAKYSPRGPSFASKGRIRPCWQTHGSAVCNAVGGRGPQGPRGVGAGPAGGGAEPGTRPKLSGGAVMAIKPNDEERTFGADRERHREVTNESARSARPSTGENVSGENGASENGSVPRGRSNRGFASMDRSKQREIASKGGRAAHQKGTAHEFDAGEARAAGRKGGVTVSKNREHMAAIGRRGGEARGANRAARLQDQGGSSGSERLQSDREVGIGSSLSQQQRNASANPPRPSGGSLGGESRSSAPAERSIERP